MEANRDLAGFLRNMRKEAGLSQYKIAEALGDNQPSISRMERGKSEATWSMVDGYLKACGKHWLALLVWWLGCGSEEEYVDLALRALYVEAPEEMPPAVREMAMEMLVQQRRGLKMIIDGIEPETDGVEEALQEIEERRLRGGGA